MAITNTMTCFRRLVPLLLAAAACSALMAPRATAAPYSVWACADGAGRMLGPSDWAAGSFAQQAGHLSTSCGRAAAGSTRNLAAVSVADGSNPPSMSGKGWGVRAAPGTTITGLDLWWVAVVSPFNPAEGRVEVFAPYSVYQLNPASRESGAAFGGQYAIGPGSERIAFEPAKHQGYRNLDAPFVSLMAWCVSLCQNGSGANRNVAAFAVYRARTIIDDPAPPQGTVAGLRDGERLRGALDVTASATDAGSGVRRLSLLVDGKVVQRVGAGGDCADLDVSNSDPREYARMRPCPTALADALRLDRAALADRARHTVSVVATDAADQAAVLGSARVALAAPPGHVARGRYFNPDLDVLSRRVLNGANAGPARIRLTATTHRGFRGRLTNRRGGPIAGARIWRTVAGSRGGWRIAGRPLTTSGRGRVRGRAPTRRGARLRLVYFPYSDGSAGARSRVIRVGRRSPWVLRTGPRRSSR